MRSFMRIVMRIILPTEPNSEMQYNEMPESTEVTVIEVNG